MDILLVEDVPQLSQQIHRALLSANHTVIGVSNGSSALTALREGRFDLLLLGESLPGQESLEILRQVRRSGSQVRVLVITSSEDDADQAERADGYLAKSFADSELLARIDQLGRRQAIAAPTDPGAVLQSGDLSLDLARHRVLRGGQPIALSPREFDVLKLLMHEPGRTFSRGELCQRIWAREHEYDTRTVEIFIMRLRKKLDRPGTASVIGTVRGVGYVLQLPA